MENIASLKHRIVKKKQTSPPPTSRDVPTFYNVCCAYFLPVPFIICLFQKFSHVVLTFTFRKSCNCYSPNVLKILCSSKPLLDKVTVYIDDLSIDNWSSILRSSILSVSTTYDSLSDVGEIRVYQRADFQSGSRVLKKVF